MYCVYFCLGLLMSRHEESENDFKEKILRNIRITPGTLQNDKSHSESFGLSSSMLIGCEH